MQTYHLGDAHGVYFIAMELIRGVNLNSFPGNWWSRRNAAKELAVFIVSRVARGLAYAHAKTDRDGRPLASSIATSVSRTLIAFEGDVKLTDFGIAKARGFLVDNEGEIVAGKADFMSPEQAGFQVTDKRSDLFSPASCWPICCWDATCSKRPPPRNPASAFSPCRSRISARWTTGWTTA